MRLLLAREGTLTLEAEPLAQPHCAAQPGMLAVSRLRVDSTDPLLYQKTTRRELYEEE